MPDHTTTPERSRIAVEPASGRFEALRAAAVEAGATIVDVEAASALVWADASRAGELAACLDRNRSVGWVSLPFAGIENYAGSLDTERVWTAAKGVYARPVAEHALMLALAGLRGMSTFARATSWSPPEGHNLVDGKVTIFGAGGITAELIGLLAGFGCEITVVRRHPDPVPGADRVVAFADRVEACRGADAVVLALALTPETRHCIGADELAAIADHGWLVNVGRGGHVDHDALLTALEVGTIGGAALDVTEPEPLPEGHPLWTHPRVLITPHIANTPEMGVPLHAEHVGRNVAAWIGGSALEGVVDPDLGY